MNCSAAPDAIAGTQQIVICVASSEPPWWSYIPTLLTPVIGLIALYFAWQNILNARNLARTKATLDLIEKKESTEHYRVLNATFSRLRLDGSFAHLNEPQSDNDKKDRKAVADYLNHYELIAIGIEKQILDGALYRSWMLGPFVRDWNDARDWIQRERWRADNNGNWTYRSAIFANFQRVACRWSADAKPLDASDGPPDGAPDGKRDEALPNPRRFTFQPDA